MTEFYDAGDIDLDEGAPFRDLIAAVAARADAEAALTRVVSKACLAGFSWTAIAGILGISREAARQRYARRNRGG